LTKFEVNPGDLIPASKVRLSLGNISDMTLWRWLNDPHYQSLNFPRPITIAKRRYWRRGDISAFIERQEATI